MKAANSLSKRQIVISACIGLLAYRLVPSDRRAAFMGPFVDWAVPLILLAGGYVVLKSRKDDLRHYQAIVQSTEAGERELTKRGRYLLVVGWVFASAGSLILVRLLLRAFR